MRTQVTGRRHSDQCFQGIGGIALEEPASPATVVRIEMRMRNKERTPAVARL